MQLKSSVKFFLVSVLLWSLFGLPFGLIALVSNVTVALGLFTLALGYLLFDHHYGKEPSTDLRYQPTSQNEHLVSLSSMLKHSYKPTVWGKNPHIQSTLMGLLRPPPDLPFRRELLKHGDGGTIAVDWLVHSEDTKESTRPLVVIVPGLTGGSFTPYIRSFSKYCFEKKRWNVLVYNHRGCGGHIITTPELFQLGNHQDLKLMIDHGRSQFPHSTMVGCGFSLGANVLTNYVCKVSKPENQLAGAISLCQGYDGNSGVDHLHATTPFYSWVLVKKLIDLLTLHQHKFHNVEGVSVQKALSAKSLKEFELYLSCPVFGYQTPDEYYIDQSCKWHLKNANVPLLLLNSVDDPLIPDFLMPRDFWKQNENILVLLVEHGGHLGFAEGFMTPNEFSWGDRLCSDFITAVLTREAQQKTQTTTAIAAN